MNDTPRTDRIAGHIQCFPDSGTLMELVDAEFARQLERELAVHDKLKLDTGNGCSICGQVPVVNVHGTYWLCGLCVSEKLEAARKALTPPFHD